MKTKIQNDLLMLTYGGSLLYGTNHPESDVDLRGVQLDPIETLLGFQSFEQQNFSEFRWGKIFSDDVTIYGLRKFLRLAMDANPNIIELLFAKPLYQSEDWEMIQELRFDILSTKIVHSFSGYALSQLKRIKIRDEWTKNPPMKPNPYKYGMIDTDSGGQDWVSSSAKNTYNSKLLNYQNYSKWLNERNPKRRALEEKYGYDTKHAAHLYRLVFEAEELLTTGSLELPLKYADNIKNVLNGCVSYEHVLEFADSSLQHLKDLEKTSVLAKKPNRKSVEDWLIRYYTSLIVHGVI